MGIFNLTFIRLGNHGRLTEFIARMRKMMPSARFSSEEDGRGSMKMCRSFPDTMIEAMLQREDMWSQVARCTLAAKKRQMDRKDERCQGRWGSLNQRGFALILKRHGLK